MSLLSDLKAATPPDDGSHPWEVIGRVMPLIVPGFELTRLDVFSGGRVAMRGKSPMRGSGRFYVVLVMSGVGTGREDGTREVLLGVDRYQAEADAMIFSRPFRAYLDPQPGAVAAWLAGVLLTEEAHSERRASSF